MILTEIKNYTDAYGIEHASPVFVATRISSNMNSNEFKNFNLATGEYEVTTGEGQDVSYEILYWPSAAAKEAGRRPLTFVSETGLTTFSFNTDEPKDVDLAIKENFLEILGEE